MEKQRSAMYLEMKFLFTPARIRMQPEVQAEFAEGEIGGALWQHLRGEWGEWGCEQAPRWQAGQALDCYYLTESGYWLRLKTSADRATTTILIGDPEEDEEDDTPSEADCG